VGIDLHIHSNASDGRYPPREVVERAAAVGLDTIALADHDTVAGYEEADSRGRSCGVKVIAACEFSVAASWGELHLLAYFLPHADPKLVSFIEHQQTMRAERAAAIIERLTGLGLHIDLEEVLEHADGAAVGRPHVARALVHRGAVNDMNDAFRKYLAAKRPAFVPKKLPELKDVTELVRSLGGVTSAAHLRSRATRATLSGLKSAGVDAVEVLHPAHIETVAQSISALAIELGLCRTGGSDWHGEDAPEDERALLGGVQMPAEWLEEVELLHRRRIATAGT
jgi:predicted metal-dependent phosphoesterase TrpH